MKFQKHLIPLRHSSQRVNCEINLIINSHKYCVISSAIGATKFKTTNINLHVSIVTLSTQNNTKLLLQQLKSFFKRKIN